MMLIIVYVIKRLKLDLVYQCKKNKLKIIFFKTKNNHFISVAKYIGFHYPCKQRKPIRFIILFLVLMINTRPQLLEWLCRRLKRASTTNGTHSTIVPRHHLPLLPTTTTAFCSFNCIWLFIFQTTRCVISFD